MNSAEIVLRAAGVLHLFQIPGVYFGRRALGLSAGLAKLDPFGRRLALAFGVGVILYVVGTGCINLCFTHSVVASQAGRALSLLQAVAWAARALEQRYSLAPYWPTNGRWLHIALSCVYGSLALGYGALSFVLAPIWG